MAKTEHRSCHTCPRNGQGDPYCWQVCLGPAEKSEKGQNIRRLGQFESPAEFIEANRWDDPNAVTERTDDPAAGLDRDFTFPDDCEPNPDQGGTDGEETGIDPDSLSDEDRQMLNDSLFVKSEGLMRMYMQPYNGKPIKAHHGPNSSQWDEELYRLYQRLDTVLVYNKAYWRSLIGSDSLDRMMLVDRFSKPSDCWRAALTDIVFGGKKTRNLILSKKSKFVMETFSQDGKGYYRVTATIPVKLLDTCYTAVFVITKDELAIVDAVCEIPRFTYKPKIYFTSHPYCEDEQSASRTHYCYHKYNGRYQLDFVQYEYEYWYKFTLEAKERGCRSTRLKISGKEECILAEHTYEGVAEYKRRYVDNEHPRTEENVRETERILRQPHNKIPW